jgi:hypothetical protein
MTYDHAAEMREQRKFQTIGDAQWPKELELLRALTDDQLREYHDAMVDSSMRTPVDQRFYLDELNRRAADRQTTTMIRLTYATLALTVAAVVVAILALFA